MHSKPFSNMAFFKRAPFFYFLKKREEIWTWWNKQWAGISGALQILLHIESCSVRSFFWYSIPGKLKCPPKALAKNHNITRFNTHSVYLQGTMFWNWHILGVYLILVIWLWTYRDYFKTQGMFCRSLNHSTAPGDARLAWCMISFLHIYYIFLLLN